MTNQEVYDLAKVLYDEAGTPYEGERDFAARYENARYAWLEVNNNQYEVSENIRAKLRPFLRNHNFGTRSRVSLTEMVDKALYIKGLTGNFTFECGGKKTERTIPIDTRSLAYGIESLSDAWNSPDDVDPYMIETGGPDGHYLEILSTNTPSDVTLFYIKEPKSFDLEENPNGILEESDAAIREIVGFTLWSRELTVENYARFDRTQQMKN